MAPRTPTTPPGRIELHDGWVDLKTRRVHRVSEAHLTPIETRLLGFLVARAGNPCTKELLLERVWSYHPQTQTRAVEATVLRLRQKLEVDPTQPVHLQTVWGVGFQFNLHATPASPSGRTYHGHAALLERLQRLDETLVLVGPGGIGKSRMATEVLARRDGVFCELTTCRTRLDGLLQICWTLGIEADADPERTLERLTAALPGRGIVVLDNLEQLSDFDPVLRIWQQTPGVVVLGTSRHAVSGVPAIEVPPLDREDALAMLRSLVESAPENLDGLIARTGGMPLAIELAARQLDVLTEDEVLLGVDTRRILLDSLERSIELLPADVAAAYQRLASLPPLELPLEVVQAVLGDGSIEALQVLVGRSLLARRTLEGRSSFRIPTALHPDAAAAPGRRDPEVAARAAQAWLKATEPLLTRLENGDRGAEDELNARSALGLALLDSGLEPTEQVRVLGCVLSRLHAQGQLASCWARVEALLPEPLPPAHEDRLRRMGAETLLRMGRPAKALELLTDPVPDAPDAHRRRQHLRAGALRVLARVDEALAILDAELDAPGLSEVQQGAIHNARALCLGPLGRLQDAYDAALQARTMLEQGRLHDRLATYNTLGNLALRMGDDATARAWLDGALPLARQHGRQSLGVVRTNLANLQICAGQLDAAEQHLRAALLDHRWSGRAQGAGLALHHLGRLQLLRQNHAEALRELSSAQVVLEQCGAHRLADWTRCFTSIALAELGDLQRAEATLQAIDSDGPLERLARAHLDRAYGRPIPTLELEDCPPELRPHVAALIALQD